MKEEIGESVAFFTQEEINHMRKDFWLLMKKHPKSFRYYSSEIGVAPNGKVLSDFANNKSRSTDFSLMKISTYLEEIKFR